MSGAWKNALLGLDAAYIVRKFHSQSFHPSLNKKLLGIFFDANASEIDFQSST